MKNRDESRSKFLGFIHFMEHAQLWNMHRITLRTEEKRQLSKERSSRKKVA